LRHNSAAKSSIEQK
jgi:hypothetical protein